jgi:hypothetical protein
MGVSTLEAIQPFGLDSWAIASYKRIHLVIYIFLNFQIEPDLGAGIDPFTPFPSNTLDETRFKPTTFRS